MKIVELIELLKKYDSDADVFIYDWQSEDLSIISKIELDIDCNEVTIK